MLYKKNLFLISAVSKKPAKLEKNKYYRSGKGTII